MLKREYLPIIFSISGSELSPEEMAQIKKYRPVGIILSKWNIERDTQDNINWEKLRKLCKIIRRYCPYILVDQEGGRVQHVQGSNCFRAPPPAELAKDVTEENWEEKCKILRQHVHAIDKDLKGGGINVNCAPVCDLLHPDLPSCIGDRSFGTNPDIVCSFAINWVKQASADGIISVLKHCPGHGCAVGDSHTELPRTEKTLPNLIQSDFKIFKDAIHALYNDGISKDSFWIMTGHVLYPAIDSEHCATQSKKIIRMVREDWGFNGKIVSDCITMEALQGELWERAIAALEAGCDYVICVDHNLEQKDILKQKEIIAQKVTEYLAAKKNKI
jgi:beta-N-acetylhexosaminidase